jgi:L-lactate dehydrogenase complex protein LldG
MSPREVFLQRVKTAVADGNRAGAATPLPERGNVGYQGAGPDPVQRFCQELAAAGGQGHVAADAEAAVHAIQSILQSHNARKILLTRGGMIDRLDLATKLRAIGLDVRYTPAAERLWDDVSAGSIPQPVGDGRDDFFSAEVGITNVHRLIAETGTVVLASQPNEPRSASLLPPVHIALADRSQLLPDLFDLFDLFSPNVTATQSLPPSCLSLITGPSKTGDIELKLVTGVHGPGEIHVILCGA